MLPTNIIIQMCSVCIDGQKIMLPEFHGHTIYIEHMLKQTGNCSYLLLYTMWQRRPQAAAFGIAPRRRLFWRTSNTLVCFHRLEEVTHSCSGASNISKFCFQRGGASSAVQITPEFLEANHCSNRSNRRFDWKHVRGMFGELVWKNNNIAEAYNLAFWNNNKVGWNILQSRHDYNCLLPWEEWNKHLRSTNAK